MAETEARGDWRHSTAVIPPEEALHGLKESPEEPRSSEVAARHAEDIAEAILAASARDSIEGQLVWIGSEEVLLYVLFLLRDAGRRGFLSFLETFRWGEGGDADWGVGGVWWGEREWLDVTHYNTLISMYRRVGNYDSALRVADAMRSATPPVQPNLLTFNKLIDCCAKLSLPHDAEAFYLALKKQRLKPDYYTFSALIMAVADTSPETAIDAYNLMLEEGIAPTAPHYSALLLGQDSLDSCLEVFEEMRLQGVRPNRYVYSILIHRFALEREWLDVERLYDEAMLVLSLLGAFEAFFFVEWRFNRS
ncbi:hypothetical protein CYMTET_36799, partial [Cymbomonas tetramitiformis]